MAHILEVTSLNNPQVKRLAALAGKRERAETGLFMVEGLQLVGFGVEAGWVLDTLIVRGGDMELVTHPVTQQAQQAAHHVMMVTGAVMEKLSRKENPQGVMGVFCQQLVALEDVEPQTANDLWVVLEEVRDPGNLGTIVRTVDAVGATGVMLLGTCTDLWAPECVRATMGSVFHVPVVKASVADFIAWKAQTPGVLLGTHLKGAMDYRQAPKPAAGEPLFLAMGTEQSGLTDALAEACDARMKIAMAGGAESLNLGIATAVMLYELRRELL